MNYRAAEREIEQLEREMEEASTPEERKEIARAIREIEHELADEERWEEEGHERGWM